jgi:hypothetical protein
MFVLLSLSPLPYEHMFSSFYLSPQLCCSDPCLSFSFSLCVVLSCSQSDRVAALAETGWEELTDHDKNSFQERVLLFVL